MFNTLRNLRFLAFILVLAVTTPAYAVPEKGSCETNLVKEPLYPYTDVRAIVPWDHRIIDDPTLKGEPVLPFLNGASGVTRLLLKSLRYGPGEVIKDYPFRSTLACEDDLGLLNLFSKLLEGKSSQGFAVTKAKRARHRLRDYLKCRRIITEFVPGRTLHDLLNDRATSKELKTRLEDIYLSKLQHLENSLRDAGMVLTFRHSHSDSRYFANGQIDSLPIAFGTIEVSKNGKLYSMIIKSDNVIVDPYDPTKMTIVDPI